MTPTETAFTQMVQEHRSTIYMVCYMFSKEPDDVNDLFQEVLIALWQAFGKRDEIQDLRAYIYRVSLNVCISQERKKKKRIPTTELQENYLIEADPANDRQIALLKQRINKLGPFDRAIILLWLENLSYEEIGQIVGISTKNVSVRLYRIKEQLKQMSSSNP
ncbi:MAG: sigma-70 family RNA polymerase sigma factor [Alloprevotella sp.]|nr:sigma-70 family RNA polymerase sigma factor [Alloprevotella sp.]